MHTVFIIISEIAEWQGEASLEYRCVAGIDSVCECVWGRGWGGALGSKCSKVGKPVYIMYVWL